MGIIDILFTDLSATLIILTLVAWIFAVIIAIVPHEFSHAFVAYKMGDDTANGWAKGVPVNSVRFRNMRKGQIWVSLSGIITNLILGIVFTVCYALTAYFLDASVTFYYFLQMFFYYTAVMNFVLAIFNFLPIYPLDGYNFLMAFFPPYGKFDRFMQQYGIIFLLIFIITPLSTWVLNGFLYITFEPICNLIWSLLS